MDFRSGSRCSSAASWAAVIGRLIAMLVVLPLLVSGTDAESIGHALAAGRHRRRPGPGRDHRRLLVLLLPAMSEVRVGLVTSYLATIAGESRRRRRNVRAAATGHLQSNGAALPAFGIGSMLLLVAGIAVTSAIIGSTAAGAIANRGTVSQD